MWKQVHVIAKHFFKPGRLNTAFILDHPTEMGWSEVIFLSLAGIPVFNTRFRPDLGPTQLHIWSILYRQLFLHHIRDLRVTLISHFHFVSGLRMCEPLLHFPLHAFLSHRGNDWSILICLLISWIQMSSSDTFRYYSMSKLKTVD